MNRRMAGAGLSRRDGARGDDDTAEPESFGLLLEDGSGVLELETSTDDIAKEEAP